MLTATLAPRNIATVLPAGPMTATLAPATAAGHIEYALSSTGMFAGVWAVLVDADQGKTLHLAVVRPDQFGQYLHECNEYTALSRALVANAEPTTVAALESTTRDELDTAAGFPDRALIFTLLLDGGATQTAHRRNAGK